MYTIFIYNIIIYNIIYKNIYINIRDLNIHKYAKIASVKDAPPTRRPDVEGRSSSLPITRRSRYQMLFRSSRRFVMRI